jgi:hypothetical protein
VVKPFSSSCRGGGDGSITNVGFGACYGGPKHDAQRHRPMHDPQHVPPGLAATQKRDNHQADGVADTSKKVTHSQCQGWDSPVA